MPLEFRRCGRERLDVLLRVGYPTIFQRSSFSSELLGFFKIFFCMFLKDLLLKKNTELYFQQCRSVTGGDLVPLCCFFVSLETERS